MPSKDYRIWLSDDAYIAVQFIMVRGRVVSFVVRLMRLEGGSELNVARYDSAHGAPHRDLLGRKRGLLQKTWYLDADFGVVLRLAVNDFAQNHEDYYRIYQTN
jgi:hypothetical protein